MNVSRRAALLGLCAVAAPAVVRTPGLLMPVRSIATPDWALTDPEVQQILELLIVYVYAVFDGTTWRTYELSSNATSDVELAA